ncbi:hypothetical protein [Burkholderia anthina]|uniref:hypothetical protein n=1 Tax=Burkholderia anthina TaxID=179879 RepID=UPI0037C111DA
MFNILGMALYELAYHLTWGWVTVRRQRALLERMETLSLYERAAYLVEHGNDRVMRFNERRARFTGKYMSPRVEIERTILTKAIEAGDMEPVAVLAGHPTTSYTTIDHVVHRVQQRLFHHGSAAKDGWREMFDTIVAFGDVNRVTECLRRYFDARTVQANLHLVEAILLNPAVGAERKITLLSAFDEHVLRRERRRTSESLMAMIDLIQRGGGRFGTTHVELGDYLLRHLDDARTTAPVRLATVLKRLPNGDSVWNVQTDTHCQESYYFDRFAPRELPLWMATLLVLRSGRTTPIGWFEAIARDMVNAGARIRLHEIGYYDDGNRAGYQVIFNDDPGFETLLHDLDREAVEAERAALGDFADVVMAAAEEAPAPRARARL